MRYSILTTVLLDTTAQQWGIESVVAPELGLLKRREDCAEARWG